MPEDVPLIFACTHPNSAVDYTFLPIITKKQSFVMVRGDVFANKWLDKFLRAMWMLPVYRMRDGFKSVSKNEGSFRECFKEFDKNGRTLIFSEGTSIQEKKLQPLMKGTARLAIDYMLGGGKKEIYVVPMANNYSRFNQFRSTVMTHFGKPIKVSPYIDSKADNQAKGYQRLSKDVHSALDKLLIQQSNYDADSWTERALNVLRLNRLDERRDWVIADAGPFNEELRLTQYLEEKGEDALPEDWKARYDDLAMDELSEGMLRKSRSKLVQWAVLISLSMIMGLAYVIHFIPYQLARWIARNKIKDPLFENTIMTIGSAVFYLIQFTLILIVLTIALGWAGFVTACSVLAVTAIYIEVVDDFRFAQHNVSRLKRHEDYKQLHRDLMELID
ncbi:MAG: hypothetical protein Salg2KO_00630 [Salibacteraceae bacterium]